MPRLKLQKQVNQSQSLKNANSRREHSYFWWGNECTWKLGTKESCVTGDSVEAYYNDTMKGGDNIGDPKLVHLMAEKHWNQQNGYEMTYTLNSYQTNYSNSVGTHLNVH